MFQSPSQLPADARERIIRELNARLADGLDLHSQIKVAHWNVKGPQFSALHPLFETFAIALANFTDQIAERAVTLGGKAYGTARHVAATSKLAEYPQETTKGMEHTALLVERIEAFLVQLTPTPSTSSPRSSPSSRRTPGSSARRSRGSLSPNRSPSRRGRAPVAPFALYDVAPLRYAPRRFLDALTGEPSGVAGRLRVPTTARRRARPEGDPSNLMRVMPTQGVEPAARSRRAGSIVSVPFPFGEGRRPFPRTREPRSRRKDGDR